MNHCNDTITMIYNTYNHTLKYIINGEDDQGIAFRNINNECQYRMAVYMTKGKNDAVLELLNYSCTKSEDVASQNPMEQQDKFYGTHSKQLVIGDEGKIVTNPENGTITSVYGYAMTENIGNKKEGVYKWKFRINEQDEEEGKCGFGIIQVEDKDDIPSLDEEYDDLFYLKKDLRNYGIDSGSSKCSSLTSEKYGVKLKKDDVIEVILECDGGYLSFIVNDMAQGNAYKIDTNHRYRMAVSLSADTEVQLLSFVSV